MMWKKIIPHLLLLCIIPLSQQENLNALDIGGKMEFFGGAAYTDEIQLQFDGISELEFYLPSSRNVDLRLVLRGTLSNSPSAGDIGIKYAYLRYHTDNGHITTGRQPISWSYGAMFNPLSYGFALDGFAGRSLTPEVDGFRVFRSLGDRSSLQGVISFPNGAAAHSLEDLSYGARLRVPIPGHDISTQVIFSNSLLRIGGTYRGDVGPVGIYSASGYLLETDDITHDVMIQGGFDYSRRIGHEYEEKTLYFQAEYMRFIMKNLGDGVLDPLQQLITGTSISAIYDLLSMVSTLELSYFSQAGIAVITETSNWMTVVNPFFLTEIGGGFELRLDASVMRGPDGDFNYASGVQISYYF